MRYFGPLTINGKLIRLGEPEKLETEIGKPMLTIQSGDDPFRDVTCTDCGSELPLARWIETYGAPGMDCPQCKGMANLHAQIVKMHEMFGRIVNTRDYSGLATQLSTLRRLLRFDDTQREIDKRPCSGTGRRGPE